MFTLFKNSCIKFIFLINYFLKTKNTFSKLISTLVSIPPFELMEKRTVLEMTLEMKLFFKIMSSVNLPYN